MTQEKKNNQQHTTKNKKQTERPQNKQHKTQKEPFISEMKMKGKNNFCRIPKPPS